MKIHNNMPIRGSQTRKAAKSSSDGVFHALFEAEIADTAPLTADTTDQRNNDAPAWQALEDSVSLLDQAMHCLESGHTPDQQLLDNIEQLRNTLRQQKVIGESGELDQAEVMLSVEIERIRAMKA